MPFRRGKHARGADGEDADAGTVGEAAPAEPSAGAMDVVLGALKAVEEPAPESAGEESQRPATAAGEKATESAPGPPQPWFRRARLAFRQWRRTRPFWAGVWCLLGGAIIIYGPLTVIKLVLVSGTVVWAGILIGALVCVMGLFMWFSPQFRQVLGVLAILFSIVSLITSNFGGFLIGMLLGVIGGAMAFGWTPLPVKADEAKATDVTPSLPQPGAAPAPGATEDQTIPSRSADAATGTRAPESAENESSRAAAHEDEPMASNRE